MRNKEEIDRIIATEIRWREDVHGIEQELRWREGIQVRFPTDANQRRINYLRDLFLKLMEKKHERT